MSKISIFWLKSNRFLHIYIKKLFIIFVHSFNQMLIFQCKNWPNWSWHEKFLIWNNCSNKIIIKIQEHILFGLIFSASDFSWDKLHTAIFCPYYHTENRLWIFDHYEGYLFKIDQLSTFCCKAYHRYWTIQVLTWKICNKNL